MSSVERRLEGPQPVSHETQPDCPTGSLTATPQMASSRNVPVGPMWGVDSGSYTACLQPCHSACYGYFIINKGVPPTRVAFLIEATTPDSWPPRSGNCRGPGRHDWSVPTWATLS